MTPSKNVAILDVLTNGIGSLIILVVLFVTKIGEDSTPPPPLAALQHGANHCDVVLLDLRPTIQRAFETSLTMTVPGSAPWTWNIAPGAAPPSGFPLAAGPRFAATGKDSGFSLLLPAIAGAHFDVRVRVLAGVPSPADAVTFSAALTGHTLHVASIRPEHVRLTALPLRTGAHGAGVTQQVPALRNDIEKTAALLSFTLPSTVEACG